MRLTTKGRYAVTAMLDVALHAHAGPVSLAEISSRQGISQAYLEQLFAKMRSKKLVNSLRGPGGGYTLAKPGAEISVSQIINSVGEGIDATRCRGEGNCDDGLTCLTHELWSDLSQRIDEFLSEITLATLVAEPRINCLAVLQEARTDAETCSEDGLITLRSM
jgi:Rrf2 family iron-sulfur cluster assembly transcriptional regulator